MTGAGSEAGMAMLDKAVFLRPMAHRGLHVAAKGIIENTAPAFQAAIAKGYGIECDLQSAADGTPFVFHDATLDRLMDATGPMAARTPANLATLHYKDQKTRLLSFAEFLDPGGRQGAAAGRGEERGRAAARRLPREGCRAGRRLCRSHRPHVIRCGVRCHARQTRPENSAWTDHRRRGVAIALESHAGGARSRPRSMPCWARRRAASPSTPST